MADPNFKASPGWWSRAKKRINVVFRIPTHIIQKLCQKSRQEIKLYLARLQQLKMDSLLLPSNEVLLFGNCDETPIQFDMATGRTYDFRGVKEVCLQTTTGLKLRLTVLMSILSNGTILPPLFIFKTKKAVHADWVKKYAEDCLIYSNEKGWITEDIMVQWFERVWLNINITPNHKPVLIFDKCKVHTSAKVLLKVRLFHMK